MPIYERSQTGDKSWKYCHDLTQVRIDVGQVQWVPETGALADDKVESLLLQVF